MTNSANRCKGFELCALKDIGFHIHAVGDVKIGFIELDSHLATSFSNLAVSHNWSIGDAVDTSVAFVSDVLATSEIKLFVASSNKHNRIIPDRQV